MPKIDPYQSWQVLIAAAAAEPNPRRRALLGNLRNHVEYEITGQLDALMSTLSDPVYRIWGLGEPIVLAGQEVIRGFYAGLMVADGHPFEMVIERIAVDTDMVVTEGRVKQVFRPTALVARGITDVGGISVKDRELWLTDAQLVTLWPSDVEGRLRGEDIYFGQDPMQTLTPIRSTDLPPYWATLAPHMAQASNMG